MLKRLSPHEQLENLLAEFEPIIRTAFIEAVNDLRSGVSLGLVIERLERRDIDGAIEALNIDRAAYSPLDEAIRRAYSGGGQATVTGMPTLRDPNGAKAVIRFDAQAYRAVQWAQEHALAPRMVEIDKDAARTMIVEGIAQGRGARRVGLDLAGRINRATGRREGGVIGLTAPQTEHVISMRERLSSGDPAEMRKVFDMNRRDRRFDRTIDKAMREERALPAEMVTRMAGRYADRLLDLRGTTIARTEGMAAFNEAQMEAYRQAIYKGAVNAADLQKTWRSAGDGRVRHTHIAMNGQQVGFDGSFQSPSGAVLRYPHDPNAPASEKVNCFAPWSRIARTGIRSAVAHHYVGDLVQLAIGDEIELSVTPNHPVLTDRGWVPAGLVNEGDYMVQCIAGDRAATLGAEPDVANMYAPADEVYRAAHVAGTYQRAGRSIVDFHGYVPDEDVDVVNVDVPLRVAIEPSIAKVLDSVSLAEANTDQGAALFDRICNIGDRRDASSRLGGMGGRRSRQPGLFGHQRSRHATTFGHCWADDADVVKTGVYDAPVDPEFGCDAQNWVSFAEKLRHSREILFALLAETFGSVASLVRGKFGFGDVFHPDVSKARNGDLPSDANLLGDGGRIHAGLAKLADAIKVLFSAPLPPFAVAVYGASGDSGIRDDALRSAVGDAVGKRSLVDGRAGLVGGGDGGNRPFVPVKVTSACRVHYEGLVYDFETSNGLIISDNLISHNCRCRMDISIDFLAKFRRRG